MIKFAGAFCTKIRVSQFYFLTLGQHPVSLQRAGSIMLVPFFIIFALLLSLPPSRNSDPGSHSRLFSPPYPLRFVPCNFIGRRFQLFLPSSTRVELCFTHARRSQQLILFSFFFLQINSKSRHGGFRTHGPTLL